MGLLNFLLSEYIFSWLSKWGIIWGKTALRVFIYQMERIRQLGSHPNLMWIVCAVPSPLVLQQLLNPAVLPIAGWQETEASSRKWLVADGSSHWNAMPQTFIYPDELNHYKVCFHTLLLLRLQFICSVGNS